MAYKCVNIASAQSLTSTFTSAAIDARYYQQVSIQLKWTGTPAGDFTLEVSNDEGPTPTNWVLLASSTQAAGGAAGGKNYEANGGYLWYRLVYTASSSTGSLNANAALKGFY